MSNIIASSYNNFTISKRESDGWVNLTQMCKANNKRLDVYLKAQETKDYIAALDRKLNYHQSVVVNSNPYSSVIEKKEGRGGGTWGHPTLALNLARWIDTDFAVWCDTHIFVLMSDGSTSLDIDPFARMFEIMAENYRDIEDQTLIDDRFYDIDAYSSWSIESGN